VHLNPLRKTIDDLVHQHGTYAGGLCSPPTYDLPALIPGVYLVDSRMGGKDTDTEARFHSFMSQTLANLLLGGRPEPERKTELETRTSLKDIEQTERYIT